MGWPIQPELFQNRLFEAVAKFTPTVPWQRGLSALVVKLRVPFAFDETHTLRRQPPLEFTYFHSGSLRVRYRKHKQKCLFLQQVGVPVCSFIKRGIGPLGAGKVASGRDLLGFLRPQPLVRQAIIRVGDSARSSLLRQIR
jgi:hypothetical protein